MLLQPGYTKFRLSNGGKLYGPSVTFRGVRRHLKAAKRTATEALNYSKRFCETRERFTHGKKEKVSSN